MNNPLFDIIGDQRRFLPCAIRCTPGKQKFDKIPYRRSENGATASDWQKPEHWMKASEAVQAMHTWNLDGISVQFGGPEHDLVGGDMDTCLTGGHLSPRAETIYKSLDTYWTRSVSGNGLHFWLIDKTHFIPAKYDEKREPCNLGLFRRSKHFAERFATFDQLRAVRVITDPSEAYAICNLLGVKPLDSIAVEPKLLSCLNNPHANADDLERAQEALSRLATWRCDDYTAWLKVGMALSQLGDSGLELWKDWSRPNVKYEPGTCEHKWKTFTPRNGITLASLYHWASEDTPRWVSASTREENSEITTDLICLQSNVLRNQTPDGEPSEANPAEAIPAGGEVDLPSIQTNDRELRDVARDAMRAQAKAGDVYVRGGGLVRVKMDEKAHASIETINVSALRGLLARSANFYVLRTRRNRADDIEFVKTPVAPPIGVVNDILNLGEWPFLPLEGVTESPVIRADGSILDMPGYDSVTRLFYHPHTGFNLPPIADSPTQEDARSALALLRSAVVDFPFAREDGEKNDEPTASEDNTIGTIVTIVTRSMIQGPVPIAVFDAPQQGTGKTKLAVICVLVATGAESEVGPAPSDPEEWRKCISAQLATGKAAIIFDNVTKRLDDGNLAAVTTATIWEDRLLGTPRTIRLPQRAVWMVTGNNVRVGGDLVRRCYPIRLDAKMSRPWQRENFTHPNLEAWMKTHRGELVGAVLTMVRAWIVAGRPLPIGIKMGGYEEWLNTVGGIMQYAGATKFLTNLHFFYETADDDTPVWEAFICRLRDVFGRKEVTAGMVYERFAPTEALTEDLTSYVPSDLALYLNNTGKGKFVVRLGLEFKARANKRHGDSQARVVQVRTAGKQASTWQFLTSGDAT